MRRLIIFIFLSVFVIACSEINTAKPDKVFYYWTATNPPKDLKLIDGQYWQSAHFTREYIVNFPKTEQFKSRQIHSTRLLKVTNVNNFM